MVQREDFSFIDSHGVEIFCYRYPATTPKAVIQLAHGVGEHAGRYDALARELAEAGYTVYTDDHRGHGQTGLKQHGGDLTKLGQLGPGGLRATVLALRELTRIIKDKEASLPLIILGHSWGSLMVQKILNQGATDYVAAVLTGTAYRMPGWMNTGDLNKKHAHLGRTGSEWLSRDLSVAEAFLQDPLCFGADVLKLFGVVDSLRLLGRPNANVPNIPILIQVGSDDPLAGGRSALKLANAYQNRSGLTDVVTKIYSGARHEVFNETNRDEVIGDLLEWLARLTG